ATVVAVVAAMPAAGMRDAGGKAGRPFVLARDLMTVSDPSSSAQRAVRGTNFLYEWALQFCLSNCEHKLRKIFVTRRGNHVAPRNADQRATFRERTYPINK
ncbi:MAG: hypothetical protein WA728_28365, partial [Xanthobacteraceae bacterium]